MLPPHSYMFMSSDLYFFLSGPFSSCLTRTHIQGGFKATQLFSYNTYHGTRPFAASCPRMGQKISGVVSKVPGGNLKQYRSPQPGS